MSIKRIWVLLIKEIIYGSKGFFFIYAILTPVGFSLFVSLIFDTHLVGKPKIGIMDPGNSQIVESLNKMESVNMKEYPSAQMLKHEVETGARDLGIVLQEKFDSKIKNGELIRLTVYIWGESLLKNRVIAGAAVLSRIRDISQKESPVELIPVHLGDKKNIPWKDRLLPLIILMSIFMSGFLIPSSSLVEEKQKRTYEAIITTAATQTDIFISKGIMGMILSFLMGITILVLNQAFGLNTGLLVFILFCGALMASCFGLIFGAFMKDIESLSSVMKGFIIILYGPAFVQMFPQIPQWTGKLFPTYYVITPLMKIVREGGVWSAVNTDVYILIVILAVVCGITGIIAKKTRPRIV